MYLSVDFDALRKPVKFLDHTRCCWIVTAKRVEGGPINSKRIGQRVWKMTLSWPIRPDGAVAKSVFDVARLACRIVCDLDRRLLLVLNLIWGHSNG